VDMEDMVVIMSKLTRWRRPSMIIMGEEVITVIIMGEEIITVIQDTVMLARQKPKLKPTKIRQILRPMLYLYA
jgi:hypothetical protein